MVICNKHQQTGNNFKSRRLSQADQPNYRKTSCLTIPRALEVEMACDPKARAWLAQQPIELVTYNDL